MLARSIVSVFALTVAGIAGCAVETSASDRDGPSATAQGADTAEGPTATKRLESLGLTDIRGIAYDPGPAADANGQYGYTTKQFVLTPDRTERKYTIYNDSDFANADFASLWGPGPDGNGRDDLRRFKQELNVNLVTLYDWNAGSTEIPVTRDHKAFIDYADSLGIKVTASVSDWIRREQLCKGMTEGGYAGVNRVAKEIYPNGHPLKGVGMLKVFNEPENQSDCPQWASLVADTVATIEATEESLGVPAAERLPIFVPVTFGIRNGLPGGAISEIHAQIVAHPKLGGRRPRTAGELRGGAVPGGQDASDRCLHGRGGLRQSGPSVAREPRAGIRPSRQ